jgi:dolichol-phosphate mannosyltransferase
MSTNVKLPDTQYSGISETSVRGVSVVTTTWNERSSIEAIVSRIRLVLQRVPHEIIVVDDNSQDGTFQATKLVADRAFIKKREGQTKGLLTGMQYAKYPVIVTIDSDLENNPAHIPVLLQRIADFDLVVASRTQLPRISEILASKTLGRLINVRDVFSNYRVFRKDAVQGFTLRGGETFGAEFLVKAKKMGLRIGEIDYTPSRRREHPRIGGTVGANLRIVWALAKSLLLYLV